MAYQLEVTVKRVEALKRQGLDAFETRNNMQVFNAQPLSIVYGQRMIYYVFYKFVMNMAQSNEKNVLLKLLSFYGAHLVTKNATIFYQGGYFRANEQIELYQQAILDLLPQLKNEAISLIDAIAPTDFVLNSPLGMSDGNVSFCFHLFIFCFFLYLIYKIKISIFRFTYTCNVPF